MELLKSKLNNNIKKLYWYKIFAGMYFSVPVMVLFWQDNGLSLTEIMVLQSIFSIFVVVLEIPTGYFADIYGRKKTLVLASASSLIAMTVYSLGYNFFHFLIAEIFFAFSLSFTSGTITAFVYDTLKDLNKEKEYKRIWGNILFYGILAIAFANILGGFIGKINLRYTLYASLPFFFFFFPLALSMQEPLRHKLVFEKGYLRKIFKTIKFNFKENNKLKWIVIYSGVIYAFNQSALWFYQPYFKLTGLDIMYFGFVFASFQVMAAVASKYAHKIEKKMGQKYSLIMLVFLVAGSYLLMSNFIFLFSFSFSFLQQFVRGFRGVVISDYINKLVSSDLRATILSMENFAGRLLYAIVVPIFGWVADVYSLVQALGIIGITALFSGIATLLIFRKNKLL